MADLTSQIQSIEEKLQGLGLLPVSLVDGVADQAFIEARDKAVRILGGMLEMPNVSVYTPQFGQQVLARLQQMQDAGELDGVKKQIADNANIELDKGWSLHKSAIRSRLEAAGVPKEEWGQIKFGGLIALIDDREQLIASLDAISQDAGVQQVQVVRQQQAQSATDIVLKAIGQEGKNWENQETQTALTDAVIKLQTDFNFPASQRYGAFSQEFSDHLADSITTAALPAGYDAASLQSFSVAMNALRANGAYKPPSEPMNVEKATRYVEEVLDVMVPELNKQMAVASQKTEDQLSQLPPIARTLLTAFKVIPDTSILDRKIPEISKVDGILDLRSQASLQGLLTVLGDPAVMDFPGDHQNWFYVPANGEYILNNLDKLEEKLASIMSEEDLAKIKPFFEKSNVQELIKALDHLYEEGLLSREALIDPNNNPIEMPAYSQRLFGQLLAAPDGAYGQSMRDLGMDRMMDLVNTNPDMLRLLDSLTIEYTGRSGMAVLMPDLEMPPIFDDVSGSKTRSERLSDFYKAAREQHQKNGHSVSQLTNDIFVLVNTVVTLPYGDKNYRREFNKVIEDAVYAAAAESDPEQAAKIFAERVEQGTAELHKEQDNGVPAYKHIYQRDVPVWKPGLQNLQIQSGGQMFEARQLAQAYDDYMLSKAPTNYQERGVPHVIEMQGYIVFKDDVGQPYVMGIDKKSMVFTVEKIDIEALKAAESEVSARTEGLDAFYEGMGEVDPGFRLARAASPSLGLAEIYKFIESDDVPSLKDFSEDYAASADVARGIHVAQIAKDQQRRTHVSSPDSRTRIGPVAKAPEIYDVSRPDVIGLQGVGAKLYASPAIIRPENRGVLSLLERNAGQPLRIGSYQGSELLILGVDVANAPENAASMAYYDKNSGRIKLAPVPADLLSADGRAVLKDLASIEQADMMEFQRQMEARPDLFKIVLAHTKLLPPAQGEILDFQHALLLKDVLGLLVIKAEQDLKSGSNIHYNGPTPSEAENQIGGTFQNASESAARPVQNAQGEFDRAAARQGALVTARNAPDGIVYASSAIGSTLSDAQISRNEPQTTPDPAHDLEPEDITPER